MLHFITINLITVFLIVYFKFCLPFSFSLVHLHMSAIKHNGAWMLHPDSPIHFYGVWLSVEMCIGTHKANSTQ